MMDTTDRGGGDQVSTRAPGARAPVPDVVASIQAGGLLLILSNDWQIEGASANSAEFLGCAPAELIGHPAANFLADDAIHALRNRLALLRDPDGIERVFAHRLLGDERCFDIAIHCRDGHVIVEAEPATANPYGDSTGTLRGMLARVDRASNRAAFLAEGTRQLRALTGFDRVIALRFDRDGSGEVVAEYARGGIEALLGKCWPASSFPQGERELLLKSPLHFNADLEAGLVEIMAIERLNLDGAALRPTAPAYADELRKSGVRASMTVALIVGGQLWGVIACHHFQPRRPGYERRSIVELFAMLFAMRLEVLELKQRANRG